MYQTCATVVPRCSALLQRALTDGHAASILCWGCHGFCRTPRGVSLGTEESDDCPIIRAMRPTFPEANASTVQRSQGTQHPASRSLTGLRTWSQRLTYIEDCCTWLNYGMVNLTSNHLVNNFKYHQISAEWIHSQRNIAEFVAVRSWSHSQWNVCGDLGFLTGLVPETTRKKWFCTGSIHIREWYYDMVLRCTNIVALQSGNQHFPLHVYEKTSKVWVKRPVQLRLWQRGGSGRFLWQRIVTRTIR